MTDDAEYKCVTGPGISFSHEVNKLFAEGWRPVAGTAAAADERWFSIILIRGTEPTTTPRSET